MSKKTIAIFTTAEGHLSIAQALETTLGHEYNVKVFFERNHFFDVYLQFYQLFPGAFKIPFNLSKNESVMQMLTNFYLQRYRQQVRSFIRRHNPDLCISTYFMYNPALGEVCDEKKIPFLNVLADPRTVHPSGISKEATTNIVFDEFQKKYGEQCCPEGTFSVLGWFTRPQFDAPYTTAEVRRELKFDQAKFNILIVSGSEGTSVIMTILPLLAWSIKSHAVEVTVACGSNKTLYKSVRMMARAIRKMNPNMSLKPLAFTPHLQKYMQAADIVIGKAGPNSLFETVAAQKPFMAITHISGQEDGNLEIIRDYNLGYVEENSFKASNLLAKLIARPEKLKQFAKPIQEMAQHNRQAREKLLTLVASLLQ